MVLVLPLVPLAIARGRIWVPLAIAMRRIPPISHARLHNHVLRLHNEFLKHYNEVMCKAQFFEDFELRFEIWRS